MKKRLLSLFLAAVSALSLSAAALAAEPKWLVNEVNKSAEFPDVNGTWCESYVDTVYRAGLMEGKAANRFDAKSNLTHAQITVIAARLYDLLTGGDGVLPSPAEGEVWYAPAYDILLRAGVLQDCDPIHYHDGLNGLYAGAYAPNDPCDRRWFVEILGNVLRTAAVNVPRLNQVEQIPDVNANADPTGYIHAFYEYGILNGTDSYGGFHAYSYLNRGQAAAMLARLSDPAQRLTFTLQPFDFCRDILNMDPKAVLLEVDGIEITAEQLAVSLRRMAYPYLSLNGMFDMAKTDAINIVATQRLAEEFGLQPDPDAITLFETSAEADAGYLGLTKEGHLWASRQMLWENALTPYILEKYGEKRFIEGLKAEVSAKAATLPYSQTKVYECFIDWNRARQLCLTAPVYST